MRKSAFTKVELAFVLAGLVGVTAVLYPVIALRPRPDNQRADNMCQTNLKQISLVIIQYSLDYSEKYPLVSVSATGWMDTLQPYLRSTQVFQCPREANGSHLGTNDYFYNARLAGVSKESLDFNSMTIMNGDGVGDSLTSANLSRLPDEWRTDPNSPAQRHLEGGANYSFADGHVKWLKPRQVTDDKPSTFAPTFAVK